jgi:hypothetical protein
MSGLLSEPLRSTVTAAGTNAASTSFTLAAFIVLVVLLLEHDLLAMSRAPRYNPSGLAALAIPLGVAVTVTLVTRIALLVH